jgi:NAD(P)-dependent dehydrogenase (short-subunit alcohol dehydrogenase family)
MKRQSSFENMTALVTGGGRGLGRHLCLQLAERGAHVVVTDINEITAAQTVEIISSAGGSAEARVFDVSDQSQCESCVKDVLSARGQIDILIANAGINAVGEFGDVPIESWRRVMETNFFGQFYMAQAVYAHMRKRRQGRIVFISSIAGLVFQPLTGSYSASKHAIFGLACSMFPDAAVHGIRVHVACPGYIDETGMFNSAEYYHYDSSNAYSLVRRMVPGFTRPGPAARAIINAVLRNRFLIVFPAHARLYWFLFRLMPEVTVRCSRFLHRIYRKARINDQISDDKDRLSSSRHTTGQPEHNG